MGNICQTVKKLCEKIGGGGTERNLREQLYISEGRLEGGEKTTESLTQANYSKNSNISSEGDIKIIKSLNSNKSLSGEISLNDFKIVKTLGKGSFGKVLLVNNIHNRKYYAMKVLKKEMLRKQGQIAHTKTEREILEKITHPFVVKLHYAFQSTEKLFLVTDYMPGGEIYYHLHKEGSFNEEKAKFYTCEMVLALEHLHKNKIIYRDLKPENILLDRDGHIKLTDFGLSKILNSINNDGDPNYQNSRAYTICGTPEYLAPEILIGKGYNRTVDWWSLGAVLFEMLVGYSPFRENKYKLDLQTYLKPIPQHKNLSKLSYSLIKELLTPDPQKRLGASELDAEEIKAHPFFKGVKWRDYAQKKVHPKFKPYIKNEEDLSNFDRMFTDEDPHSLKNDKFNLFPTPKKFEAQSEKSYENFTFIREEIDL